MAIQEELTSTENKVAFSRQAFNDAVTAYNMYRESFPRCFLLAHLASNMASLLEFDDKQAIQTAPSVSF